MLTLVHGLPTWLLAASIVLVANAFALGGLRLVAWRIPVDARRAGNDAAAAIVSVIGVVYAILLAFIAIEVWQDFEKADETVTREASLVGDLWRDAGGLPAPARARVREALRAYAEAVVKDEWTLQRKGEASDKARRAIDALAEAILSFEPAGAREQVALAEMLRQMNRLLDERRQREGIVDSGVQPVVWAVVLVASGLALLSPCFFGMASLRAHMAITAVLATSVGLVIFLILTLDYPFRGGTMIEPDAFQRVLASMV